MEVDPRRRRLALAVIVTLAAFAVGARPALPQPPPEVKVTIQRDRFVPAELRVRAGVPFVLVVTNADNVVHEFEIEALDVEKRVGVGQTVRIPVDAVKAGRYAIEDDDATPPLKALLVAE